MTKMDDKKTGLAHFLAAASYSWAGFRRLLGESAFRHELLLAFVVLAALIVFGVPAGDIVISAVLFLALFGVEALNTAIEEIIDRISPEVSVTGRHAKDLGSFAVFCLISASCLYSGFALVRALFA